MVSFSVAEMPTTSSLLSAYASLSTSIMLFRTMFNQIVPKQLQEYILSTIRLYWKPKSSKLSLVIEEKDGMSINHMYEVSETYLCTKISPKSECLMIAKDVKEKHIKVKFAQSESIVDYYQDIEITWTYVREEQPEKRMWGNREDEYYGQPLEKRYTQLSFEKKHKETILNSYLPFVIERAAAIKDEKRFVKLHSLKDPYHYGGFSWDSVNLEHPSTFDKLAMDRKLKKEIMDDLDLFVQRKEYYKKVGKAWKRGYLLYGPPGTGKSSLVAAMANHLKFDIFDLQLTNVGNDSCLRKLLLKTPNRSILVIEDIDCSVELPDRNGLLPPTRFEKRKRDSQFSLSGLLNFIDGLWSCCGDERIIIFTTNHKDKLDMALLRPGRMDVHIHMTYLTSDGFKVLAANYLDIHDHHWRFEEIEELIDSMEITPAEVAEELMKSNDTEVCLEGLFSFLKCKKMKGDGIKSKKTEEDEDEDEDEVKEEGIEDKDDVQEAKRGKF